MSEGFEKSSLFFSKKSRGAHPWLLMNSTEFDAFLIKIWGIHNWNSSPEKEKWMRVRWVWKVLHSWEIASKTSQKFIWERFARDWIVTGDRWLLQRSVNLLEQHEVVGLGWFFLSSEGLLKKVYLSLEEWRRKLRGGKSRGCIFGRGLADLLGVQKRVALLSSLALNSDLSSFRERFGEEKNNAMLWK